MRRQGVGADKLADFEILPESDHVRLVHADIDAAGSKTLRARSEHFFDEFVGMLLACK